MTFLERAALAAMQSLILAHPRDTPALIASKAASYAKELEIKLRTPASTETLIWYWGKQINVKQLRIDDLEFSKRVKHSLDKVHVKTVHDLLMLTELEFKDVFGIGANLRKEVYDFLKEHRLKFSEAAN